MTVETGRRIHWTDDQKTKVLNEAARLHLLHPEWNNLRLLREAQKTLPEGYQRNLQTVSWMGSFNWFVDGLPDAIIRVSHLKEVVQGEKIFSENGKFQEPTGLPTEELVGVGVTTLLSTLVKAMEELRDETTKGLPVGIVGRLDDLQARLSKVENHFQQFLDQGLLFRLIPAQPGVVGSGFVTAQSVVQQDVSDTPVQKIPPKEPEKKTLKPRVIVLNTDSGHVRNGIEVGTRGHVRSLKFQDTYGVTTPEFKDFDYVLAYKKTPITWIEAAKKFYPPGKFKAVSGGAMQVSEAIKALPHIEITDELRR